MKRKIFKKQIENENQVIQENNKKILYNKIVCKVEELKTLMFQYNNLYDEKSNKIIHSSENMNVSLETKDELSIRSNAQFPIEEELFHTNLEYKNDIFALFNTQDVYQFLGKARELNNDEEVM